MNTILLLLASLAPAAEGLAAPPPALVQSEERKVARLLERM